MYTGLRDWLWITVVLLFLIPVVISMGGNGGHHHGPVTQGHLVIGRAGLDSLLAEAEGEPAIINFWATWCSPCVGELPDIDRIYSTSGGSITAVAVDIGDPELETLLEFREEFSVSMPMVWLDGDEAMALKADWDLADVLPITVILGPTGMETSRFYGARSSEFFQGAISGAEGPDTSTVEENVPGTLHIIVAGDTDDPVTLQLLDAAVGLAGEEGVEHYDPTIPLDLAAMDSLFLPLSGFPYAQPCVGDACGRPAGSVEELLQVVENLTP